FYFFRRLYLVTPTFIIEPIFLSSVFVLILLKIPQAGEFSAQQRKRMRRRLIWNTILILIPCLVVAGFMVKQANTDNQTVTGFETTVSVEQITKEIKILFPAVNDVKIGTLDCVDESGNLHTETSVVVYLQREFETEEAERFTQWIQQTYSEDCQIIFVQAQT
ncbi:MAG: hypothetical protein ACI4LB_06035, partial [Candidatus Fimenecus sp.]